MEQRTRSILFGAGALIAVTLIGVWWWSGFTLDFTRFFAAEPTATCPPGTVQVGFTNSIPAQPICAAPSGSPIPTCPPGEVLVGYTNSIPPQPICAAPSGTGISLPATCRNLPPGCTCQQVQCVRAPCDPIVVCPTGTPPEGAVRCAPEVQSVSVGSSATLTATGGAGLYVWYAPGGTPPNTEDASFRTTGNGSPFNVSYTTPGIKKVTVQSPRVVNGVNDPANPVIDSVACTVVVTQ